MNKANNPSPAKTVELWVNQYADAMYSWALYKTSNIESAEDLVQDAFLTAYQQFEKFRGDSNPKTWLMSILNHKISAYYRKLYQRQSHSHQSDTSDSGSGIFTTMFDEYGNWKSDTKPTAWVDNDDSLLDDKDFNAVLSRCLKSLPERSRTVILLKFIEQQKSEMICQELNISVTNLWQLLHRAKLMLRKCIDIKWFKS